MKTQYAETLSRQGVYVVWGPAETSSEKQDIYIGEGYLKSRIDQHELKKPFWQAMLLFTLQQGSLSRDICHYLEARLYERAHEVGRAEITNSNKPKRPALDESDVALAEGYFHEFVMVGRFPGLDVFELPERPQLNLSLERPTQGIKAIGWETGDGQFAVGEGALVAGNEMPSVPPGISQERVWLLEHGVLKKNPPGLLRFTRDYIFPSPSRAAAVVIGGAANGLVLWKDQDGRTLKDIRSTGSEKS